MSLLSIKNLGKAFRTYSSEWHRFARWFGISAKPSAEHWVLRNINFEIQSGEAVGIIGQNGAGKSTLLKMITGTLQPTEGHVQIHGRIAAILELGMGFNPELTGRQNVMHAAGLMGFNIVQINLAMPDIEAFADIGEYFDEPVRTYSSGMQMRVAFSVVTAYRPEFLIVDEALSVGDAAFQRKCFRKIESFLSEGTTLLLVSHDVETVKKLCSKAIFLCNGTLNSFGSAKPVCDEYERILFGAKKLKNTLSKDVSLDRYDSFMVATSEMEYGNKKAEIDSCWIQKKSGEKVNVVEKSAQLEWCFNVIFNADIKQPLYNMQIKTSDGIVLFGVNSEYLGYKSLQVNKGSILNIKFNFFNHLAPGTYFLDCGVKENNSANHGKEFLHRRVDAAILKVIPGEDSSVARGLVDLNAQFFISFDNA